MGLKITTLVLGLFAMLLLVSYKVAARELAESFPNSNAEAVERRNEVGDQKLGGNRATSGGGIGFPGFPGFPFWGGSGSGYGNGYGSGYGGYGSGYPRYGGYGQGVCPNGCCGDPYMGGCGQCC